MQYAGLLKAGVKAGVIIAGAVWAASDCLPSNATIPYIVRVSGQEAAPRCVYGALDSLQRTMPQQVDLIPVLNGEDIAGVIVMKPGDRIPNPANVRRGENVKIEEILWSCKPHNA